MWNSWFLSCNQVDFSSCSYDSNYHRPYHDDEDTRDTGYGYSTHGYNHYRPPANSLKGKVEKKYWHTKQTMIQKLGKGQDSYVVAGDAEVDARLEVGLVMINNTVRKQKCCSWCGDDGGDGDGDDYDDDDDGDDGSKSQIPVLTLYICEATL